MQISFPEQRFIEQIEDLAKITHIDSVGPIRERSRGLLFDVFAYAPKLLDIRLLLDVELRTQSVNVAAMRRVFSALVNAQKLPEIEELYRLADNSPSEWPIFIERELQNIELGEHPQDVLTQFAVFNLVLSKKFFDLRTTCTNEGSHITEIINEIVPTIARWPDELLVAQVREARAEFASEFDGIAFPRSKAPPALFDPSLPSDRLRRILADYVVTDRPALVQECIRKRQDTWPDRAVSIVSLLVDAPPEYVTVPRPPDATEQRAFASLLRVLSLAVFIYPRDENVFMQSVEISRRLLTIRTAAHWLERWQANKTNNNSARFLPLLFFELKALVRDLGLLAQSTPMTHTISPVAAPGPAADPPPKVDIGIVTIRDDEFRAVLARFPDKIGTIQGARRTYTLRHADAGGDKRYRIAVLRLIEQGQGEAQDAARDLIEDLAPRLVLVVGIAGGRPSDDVKLGDVVVSTRIHDFTIEARKAGKAPTYDVTGGPIDKALAAVVANLAAREDELGDWTASLPPQPPVNWTKKGQLYGPADWQRELRDKLEHHHGPEATPRAPTYAAGPIASSDRLVKDPDLLNAWLQDARSLLAIEMESGGVYRAARERCPMLAIRGISDIVGLKRADAWTKYACTSAAAFTCAFLRTRPIELGSAASVDVAPSHATSGTEPAVARQQRHGGSSPIEEGHMTSNELLTRLSKLLPPQFEEVLYRAQIPLGYLPGPTASQTERAVGVMRYIEQQNQLDQLARIVQQVVTGGGAASPSPR